ncbi:hypothetical protein AXF42_Ash013619 [Apostasia shenzhenica]|uniref:Uncharacterized protein n=1 Tax=Apostasia shenzhenica TaxID=1088818 RepID=A0A2I0APE1_9ASPA|nr:hypothetical protein AXF42_Ash013619 [Apostasia shenzhenica]
MDPRTRGLTQSPVHRVSTRVAGRLRTDASVPAACARTLSADDFERAAREASGCNKEVEMCDDVFVDDFEEESKRLRGEVGMMKTYSSFGQNAGEAISSSME